MVVCCLGCVRATEMLSGAVRPQMIDSDGCSGVGSIQDLKKKYQTVVDEKQQLEKQLLEFRKRERCCDCVCKCRFARLVQC